MLITKNTVADQLAAYLRHAISLAQLIDWAEEAMREGEIADQDFETIRDIIARLGVSDVRTFGLTWEDCEEALRRLGYTAQLNIVAA